jgi:hypothetical protein
VRSAELNDAACSVVFTQDCAREVLPSVNVRAKKVLRQSIQTSGHRTHTLFVNRASHGK